MTASEQKVYAIWCEAFEKEDIATDDNFFEMGGNSLIAMRILNSLNQKLDRIDVTDFFEYQTIQSIAAKIDADYQWRNV